MDTWGSQTLHVMSYSRRTPNFVSEKSLIPSTSTGPQSTVTGRGRQRHQVSITGKTNTTGEWDSLYSDYENDVRRTATFTNADFGFNMPAVLRGLEKRTRKGVDRIYYSATLLETNTTSTST